jgi:eukaryotic-like serine/threonine-protein kinase
MTLRGERQDEPTYIDLRDIADGSNQLTRCAHRILGAHCVQKTVPIGPGSSAFAEPRLLEALDHDHIPPVREAQFDPDRRDCITFVMPWYPGGSVARALLGGERFSIYQSIGIARDVLDALEYLHTAHGHVHRDVKTSNVLLSEDRRIGYLTDFERAAALAGDGTTQAVLTTVFYMPPECAPTGCHSVRSDLYATGLVLYEMLSGRFRWEEFDPEATERRVLKGLRSVPDSMLSSGSFAPHVPDDLVRIVRKATHRDPSSRFSSARSFISALNGLVAW